MLYTYVCVLVKQGTIHKRRTICESSHMRRNRLSKCVLLVWLLLLLFSSYTYVYKVSPPPLPVDYSDLSAHTCHTYDRVVSMGIRAVFVLRARVTHRIAIHPFPFFRQSMYEVGGIEI